ncbi:unnamed protein product [Orchesella dallaii]|uniref:Uncharacterized protein n=1 Tax=Orchesella dallaii TaxID=48710 RepID=A0ABP1RJY4_9HEXA
MTTSASIHKLENPTASINATKPTLEPQPKLIFTLTQQPLQNTTHNPPSSNQAISLSIPSSLVSSPPPSNTNVTPVSTITTEKPPTTATKSVKITNTDIISTNTIPVSSPPKRNRNTTAVLTTSTTKPTETQSTTAKLTNADTIPTTKPTPSSSSPSSPTLFVCVITYPVLSPSTTTNNPHNIDKHATNKFGKVPKFKRSLPKPHIYTPSNQRG